MTCVCSRRLVAKLKRPLSLPFCLPSLVNVHVDRARRLFPQLPAGPGHHHLLALFPVRTAQRP